MASGGARSLLAFWIGGASASTGAARPVGIREHYEPRVYQPIRGRGIAAIAGLLASSRGIVVKPKRVAKARPLLPAPVLGMGAAGLPQIAARASGAFIVTGAAAVPLTIVANSTGTHYPFHDDQMMIFAAFALL